MIQFALGWICIILLPTAESKLVLVLTPKNPMARVGERLVLTCSASECAGDVTLRWPIINDKPHYGRMQNNNTASQLIFDPVGLNHENKVACFATCGYTKDKAQKSAEVKVYAFPKDPIISGSELLTEGQDNDLTCTVPDVYPADRLKVQWLLGDRVLKDDKALNPVVKGVVQTVTSVLKYKPTTQDHGQNVTCRATLDIMTEPVTRETVASITVQYSPRDVHISENTQVNIGDNFTLTCHAKGHPEPTVLWRRLEKDGRSVVAGEGGTLQVKETSWSHDGEYECMTHNTVGNLTARVTVYVQGLPGKPVLHLSPSGELKEGDSLTISCQSEGGSLGRVALWQVVDGQGAELQSSLGNASITIQSLTVRDSGRYECEATNPYGSVTSSINVTVRAPFIVSLTPENTITHIGDTLKLICVATGCPDTVSFTWSPSIGVSAEDQSPGTGFLTLEPVTMEHKGLVVCSATCRASGEYRQGSINLEVYSFLKDPIISGSELLTEGQDIDLTCTVPDVYPADHLKVQWLLGDEVLKEDKALKTVGGDIVHMVTSVLKYKPTAQDHGQNVTCRATLDIKTEPETREAVASMNIRSKTLGSDWYDPKTVAIPAVGLVSVATAAGFLIRFLRKAKANSHEISRVV